MMAGVEYPNWVGLCAVAIIVYVCGKFVSLKMEEWFRPRAKLGGSLNVDRDTVEKFASIYREHTATVQRLLESIESHGKLEEKQASLLAAHVLESTKSTLQISDIHRKVVLDVK